jgi:hypothetical protein
MIFFSSCTQLCFPLQRNKSRNIVSYKACLGDAQTNTRQGKNFRHITYIKTFAAFPTRCFYSRCCHVHVLMVCGTCTDNDRTALADKQYNSSPTTYRKCCDVCADFMISIFKKFLLVLLEMQAQQGVSKFTGVCGLFLALKTTYQFISTFTQLTMQANNPMNGIPVQVPQFQSQPVNVFGKPPTLWRNDSNSTGVCVAEFSTHFQQPFEHSSKWGKWDNQHEFQQQAMCMEWPSFPQYSCPKCPKCPPHICPKCPKCPPHICPECPILNRSSTENLNQCVYDLSVHITGIVYSCIQYVVLGVAAIVCQMYRSFKSISTPKQDGQLPRVTGPIDFGNLVVNILAGAVCQQILCEYSETLLLFQRHLQQNWAGLCLLMFILVSIAYLTLTVMRFYNRHQCMQELQQHLDILAYCNIRLENVHHQGKHKNLVLGKCDELIITNHNVVKAFLALTITSSPQPEIQWDQDWDNHAQTLAEFLEQSYRLLVQSSTARFVSEAYKTNMYMMSLCCWRIARLNTKLLCRVQRDANGTDKRDDDGISLMEQIPTPGKLALEKVLDKMWALIDGSHTSCFSSQ